MCYTSFVVNFILAFEKGFDMAQKTRQIFTGTVAEGDVVTYHNFHHEVDTLTVTAVNDYFITGIGVEDQELHICHKGCILNLKPAPANVQAGDQVQVDYFGELVNAEVLSCTLFHALFKLESGTLYSANKVRVHSVEERS